MICPECGTRVPKGKTECHICGYKFIEEDTQRDSFALSILSTVIAMVALILTAANASLEFEFPKTSITNGNITITQPPVVPGTSIPLIIPLDLGFAILIIIALFLFVRIVGKSYQQK
jgi:hypothetical protein